MSSDKAVRKRPRWRQIGLRTLLLLFTALVFCAAYLRVYVQEWEARDAIRERIEAFGGTYEAKAGPKWLAFAMGKDECPVLTGVSFMKRGHSLYGPELNSAAGEDLLRSLAELSELEQIEVPDRFVTDEILQAWKGLKNLKKLALRNTLVQHPENWPDWPLTELDVSGTLLEEADLAALAKYTKLRKLEVNRTGFGDQEVIALQSLAHLQSLEASNTRVTLQSREVLNNYPSLTSFMQYTWLPRDSQYDPKLRPLQLGSLKTWNSIASIDDFNTVMRERLRNMSSQTFKRNTDRLDYSPDCIEWTQLDAVGERDDVSEISAHSFYFDDDTLSHLDQFPELRFLQLRDTWVSDDGLRHLQRCPGLVGLALNNARITDEGLHHLLACQSLQTLDLSGTRVTHQGLLTLAKLPNLTTLTLPPAAVRGEEILLLTEMPSLHRVAIASPGKWDIASHTGERLGIVDVERIRKLELHFISVGRENMLRFGSYTPLNRPPYDIGSTRAIYTLLRLTSAAQERLLDMVSGIKQSELK